MKILVHIGFSLFVKTNEVIYFDSFGVEHIPKEINKFTGNKKIKASIFRIQAYDSNYVRIFLYRIYLIICLKVRHY